MILDKLSNVLFVPYIYKYRKGGILLQKILGHKSLPYFKNHEKIKASPYFIELMGIPYAQKILLRI